MTAHEANLFSALQRQVTNPLGNHVDNSSATVTPVQEIVEGDGGAVALDQDGTHLLGAAAPG